MSQPPRVTVPVSESTYHRLAGLLAVPDTAVVTHELRISGELVRGRWVVVAVRADFELQGERTFWVSLEYQEPFQG